MTTTGEMINISEARRLGMQSDFDGEMISIVATFGTEDLVTLAMVRRDGADNMYEKAQAMFRALVTAVRDGDSFCDFSGT
jgi:hypothetical protein